MIAYNKKQRSDYQITNYLLFEAFLPTSTQRHTLQFRYQIRFFCHHPESYDQKSLEESTDENIEDNDGIITSADEIEAYNIVKAIVRSRVEAKRVVMRDTKSYCGVLLDDNNRKPICRFHFNSKQKYIGLMKEKVKARIAISSLDEIFQYESELLSAITDYEGEPAIS